MRPRHCGPPGRGNHGNVRRRHRRGSAVATRTRGCSGHQACDSADSDTLALSETGRLRDLSHGGDSPAPVTLDSELELTQAAAAASQVSLTPET